MTPGEAAYAKWCERVSNKLSGLSIAKDIVLHLPWHQLKPAQKETWEAIAAAAIAAAGRPR